MANNPQNETRGNPFVRWCKNNKWISIVVIGGIIIICIGEFTGAVEKIRALFKLSPSLSPSVDVNNANSNAVSVGGSNYAPIVGGSIITNNFSANSQLAVAFDVDKFTGAVCEIGNKGQGIISVREPTLHWTYRECSSYTFPSRGAQLVSYRYEADLTTAAGLKLLDTHELKYGAGNLDRFYVQLLRSKHGIYTIWLTFRYNQVDETSDHVYETKHIELEDCEKM